MTIDAQGVRADVPPHYRLVAGNVPVTLYRSPINHRNSPDDECEDFLRLFERVLEQFRPDILITYGGDRLAMEIRARARARKVAVVFALHNLSDSSDGPFADVDAILVSSQFAADHYRAWLGLDCTVLPYGLMRSSAFGTTESFTPSTSSGPWRSPSGGLPMSWSRNTSDSSTTFGQGLKP